MSLPTFLHQLWAYDLIFKLDTDQNPLVSLPTFLPQLSAYDLIFKLDTEQRPKPISVTASFSAPAVSLWFHFQARHRTKSKDQNPLVSLPDFLHQLSSYNLIFKLGTEQRPKPISVTASFSAPAIIIWSHFQAQHRTKSVIYAWYLLNLVVDFHHTCRDTSLDLLF